MVGSWLFSGDSGPGFWIHDDDVELAFCDFPAVRASVLRLSATAAWFVADPAAGLPFPAPARVEIRARGRVVGPVMAQIEAQRGDKPGPIRGLTFLEPSLGVARQLVELLRDLAARGAAEVAVAPPVVREDVTDPARIRGIVGALSAQADRSGPEDLRLDRLDAEDRVHFAGPCAFGAAPFSVDLTGYNSVYRLHFAEILATGADHAVMPLPVRVERLRRRAHRRHEVEAPIFASFQHPIWLRLPLVRRAVHDISFGGLSFITSPDDDLVFPGLVLPFLDVVDGQGERLRVRGEVRSLSVSRGQLVARLSVKPCTPRDDEAWSRLVASALNPATRTGGEWAEPTWDLLHEAGYFNLSGKEPSQFEVLKSAHLQAARRGADVPGLFCSVVVPSSRGVEATVSIMKVYRGTWMGHQLAKRRSTSSPTEARRVLRDLYYRLFEQPQGDPKARWVMAYLEANAPWNRLAHFAFAQRHAASGKAIALPFRLLEARAADRSALLPEAVEIGLARYHEIEEILDLLRRTRPAAYIDALDLVPDRVELSSVRRSWERVGLTRGREILVARRKGMTLAAAIVESGETGVNLFRLLDSVRLVPLAVDGEGVLPALLDAARDWFAERQKDTFVVFRETEDPGPVEVTKLGDLGEGRLWVVDVELLPEFLEHVFQVTGPRRGGGGASQRA